jgi:hypothetical protein
VCQLLISASFFFEGQWSLNGFSFFFQFYIVSLICLAMLFLFLKLSDKACSDTISEDPIQSQILFIETATHVAKNKRPATTWIC